MNTRVMNGSGAWQGSFTTHSFRVHIEPMKTYGVLLLSSEANEKALDIVFYYGLRTEAKFES